MVASPSEVSASAGPLRRVSVDDRLPTASVGLVPLEPTAEGVSPTASSTGGQTRATATTEARDGTSAEEGSAST
ncbi:unnamed protein product [Ectocarpus sp. 8 AP-2014]